MKSRLFILLKESLKDFKKEILEQTETWAKKELETNKLILQTYQTKGEKGFETVQEYKKALKIRFSSYWFLTNEFIQRMVKAADDHFENSLIKLVERINKKGLQMGTLKISNVSLKENIEIIITDGSKTVRLYTIIAEGVIQKPHYRYLLK